MFCVAAFCMSHATGPHVLLTRRDPARVGARTIATGQIFTNRATATHSLNDELKSRLRFPNRKFLYRILTYSKL
jgi:hypothetical protein